MIAGRIILYFLFTFFGFPGFVMNDLRLIILIIGLCVIVLIYFWETSKQRRKQRRQTVNYTPQESETQELKINPAKDEGADYSSVISDLNEALNKSRQEEDEAISRIFSREPSDSSEYSIPGENPETVPATGDLFGDTDAIADQGRDKSPSADSGDIYGPRIISLFVAAGNGGSFSTDEIFRAAKETGLEFGDLNIFHHFGIGSAKAGQPLFSVADMYEPGSFDPDGVKGRTTRGLSLFMCLPVPVDGGRVFEMMLNTANELAGILGGVVLGPDRKVLNKVHLESINRIIKTA